MANRFNLASVLVGAPSDRIALSEPIRSWTYAQLGDTVARFAAALVGLGVERKDRVAILISDGLEAAASLLAVWHAGAVAVPLSDLLRANDVRALLNDAGATAIVVEERLRPVIGEVLPEIPSLKTVIVVGEPGGGQESFAALVAAHAPIAAAETERTDTALLLYTTGPSDRPRGVQHTHEAPLASARAYAQVLPLAPDDRVFSLGRLTTAFGMGAGLIFPLAAGAQAVFLPGQLHSQPVFDVLTALRPTVLFATPTLYSQLLTDLALDGRAAAEALGPSLRAAVSGSETLPAPLVQRIRTQLGVEVLGGYGLTEAFHFVLATPPGESRPGSAGRAVPGYMVRVVGPDGEPVPAHEIGTLEIAGPTLFKGYWNRADETRITLKNGWLRTADRFLVDDEGFFYHCGRTDDLFKVSGRWVSPPEIERTLLAHPAVWECAVIGVEDAEGLTKPLAYVVANVGHAPSPTLEFDLIEFVKREIAPYKFPRWIEFVDQLPKGTHGKVLRYKLPRRRPTRKPHTIPPGG